MRTHCFFASPPFSVNILNLGDFEDVYYATCAKSKELLQGVDLLLANGFRSPEDTYFVYHHDERLSRLEAISIEDFKASLLLYERILYSSELTELLNKGIMKKSMRHNKYDGQKQLIVEDDDDVQVVRHGIWKKTEEPLQRWHGVFQESLGWLEVVRQLQDTSNMGCSMIFGSLAEKYRLSVLDIESKGASIDREPTPDAPQAFQEVQSNSVYVSPYNLDERAKKLDIPGGPEMPCLCDPDCICAPVCASDPIRNCLCEENGLFTCVTQGMDIDDLDVPDLVRRKRQGSESSGSNAASLIAICPNRSIHTTYYAAAEGHSISHHRSMNEVERQKHEQQNITSNDGEIEDKASMRDRVEFSDPDDDHFWQGQNLISLEASSLLHRNTLTQPFSKPCEYPPKCSSMAQRLFNSRSNGVANNKRASNLKLLAKGHVAIASTGKALKKTKKRSLAGVSFTSLKLALRRDSQMHS